VTYAHNKLSCSLVSLYLYGSATRFCRLQDQGLESLKGDFGRKIDAKCWTVSSLINRGEISEMSELTFQAQPSTQPWVNFWRRGRGLRLGGGWKIKLKFKFWRNFGFWLGLGLLGLEMIHSPVFASVNHILRNNN